MQNPRMKRFLFQHDLKLNCPFKRNRQKGKNIIKIIFTKINSI